MIQTKSEDAVSPVIGVMLMLVVTIVIAAVVAVFAGGIGMDNEPAPTTVLDVTRFTDEYRYEMVTTLDNEFAKPGEKSYYYYENGDEYYFEITNIDNLKSGKPDSSLTEWDNYIVIDRDFLGFDSSWNPLYGDVTMYYLLDPGETKDSLTFAKKGKPYGGNEYFKQNAFITEKSDTLTPAGQKLTLSCLYGDPLDLSKVTISIYSSGSGKLIHEVKGLTGTISPGETKNIPFKIDLKRNKFVDIVIYYGGNNKLSEVENLKVIEVIHEE